jgi:hypothetical protein
MSGLFGAMVEITKASLQLAGQVPTGRIWVWESLSFRCFGSQDPLALLRRGDRLCQHGMNIVEMEGR